MREYLYRGKRIDNGEWVEGSYVYAHKFFGTGEAGHFIADIYGENMYGVIPETVGEYTGLPDKNGKKIFEGDILQITSTVRGKQIDNGLGICCGFESEKRQDYGIVLHDNHTGGYRLKVIHNGKYKRVAKFASGHLSIYNAEVVGNIYDNPELLEDKQ